MILRDNGADAPRYQPGQLYEAKHSGRKRRKQVKEQAGKLSRDEYHNLLFGTPIQNNLNLGTFQGFPSFQDFPTFPQPNSGIPQQAGFSTQNNNITFPAYPNPYLQNFRQ